MNTTVSLIAARARPPPSLRIDISTLSIPSVVIVIPRASPTSVHSLNLTSTITINPRCGAKPLPRPHPSSPTNPFLHGRPLSPTRYPAPIAPHRITTAPLPPTQPKEWAASAPNPATNRTLSPNPVASSDRTKPPRKEPPRGRAPRSPSHTGVHPDGHSVAAERHPQRQLRVQIQQMRGQKRPLQPRNAPSLLRRETKGS